MKLATPASVNVRILLLKFFNNIPEIHEKYCDAPIKKKSRLMLIIILCHRIISEIAWTEMNLTVNYTQEQ